MDPSEFFIWSEGATAREAFDAARAHEAAREEAGLQHGVSRARAFIWLIVPRGQRAFGFAEALIDEQDPRITNNPSVVGCVRTSPPTPDAKGQWLFFGVEHP